MTETVVTLVGNVATGVEFKESPTGGVARFRFAVPVRRWDRAKAEWTDGPTSFYTVWAWRTLAANLAASVSLGEPLVVQGRLRVREEEREGRRRTFVDIEAAAAGHDLNRGTSAFRRVARMSARGTPQQGEAVAGLLARAGGGRPAERDPWAVPAEDPTRHTAEAPPWSTADAGSGGGPGAATGRAATDAVTGWATRPEAGRATDAVTGWATRPEAGQETVDGAVGGAVRTVVAEADEPNHPRPDHPHGGQRQPDRPQSEQQQSDQRKPAQAKPSQSKPAQSKPDRPKRSRSPKPDRAAEHVGDGEREASPQPF